MDKEMRLDALLVERGLISGRDRAKELIAKGLVLVDGAPADKPAQKCSCGAALELLGQEAHYVSRAAAKLREALDSFSLSLEGKTVLDVGASTGGFTQCALERGAKRVYAVDVGRDQLAPVLREDPRVMDLQQTDIRLLRAEQLPETPDFAACDVSFISLTKVLGPVKALLADDGQIVCLIKPQFEAGREKVGKKGVVRDLAVHKEVMEQVITYAKSLGFLIKGLDFSPIRGPEGNIEYLLYIQKMENGAATFPEDEWNEWQKVMDETIQAAQEHAVKHAEDISG